MREWHYIRHGQQYGPVAETSIHAWLESGFLGADDMLWTEGMTDWTSVEEIPAFGGAPKVGPRRGQATPPVWNQGEDPFPGTKDGQPQPMAQPRTYAGFWWRAAAYIVDSVILSLVLTLLWLPKVVNLEQMPSYDELAQDSQFLLATFVLQWLYNAFFEASSWQGTPGKRIFRLKVTDLEGNGIGFARATLRHGGKIISILAFYLGFLLAAFTRRKQTLHDLISNCLVVRD